MTFHNINSIIPTRIKVIFLAVSYLCLLQSCKKENETKRNDNASLSIITGDNQSGIYGELLKDTIVLKVSTDSVEKYLVKFELLQGNGEVSLTGNYPGNGILYPDVKGVIKVRWRLGCNSANQKVRFLIYSARSFNWQGQMILGAVPLDSIEARSSGIPPVGWGRSCGCNLGGPIKVFSSNTSTLYMVSNGLYSSDDKGINWNKIETAPNWNEIVDAKVNTKGWMYILTRFHGLYYSQDLKTWQRINTGILDYRDPTAFAVDDSTLFVSFYFDGPYKSDNNGAFWRKILVDQDGDRYYHINRHPNGNLYLFDKWSKLHLSTNNGLNWQKLNVSYQYIRSEINDFKIDKNGTLYIGSGDATISELSAQSYTGEFRTYYQWNASSQNVYNIQFSNNDVYYLVAGNPNPGLYSKNNNWSKIDLGFNKMINYYYAKNDGTFLLASEGALFYKK